MNCDVLVIGGGSAGLAAAISAARVGADTILVERTGTLGGMATTALVHSICGLYFIRDTPVLANPGFPSEFAGRLMKASGSSPTRMGKVDVLLHHPTQFSLLCDELASETKNLRCLFHTEVSAVERSGIISNVQLVCRGTKFTVSPKTVIDASGDAIVSALADIPFKQQESERLQRPAFIFSLYGVLPEALEEERRFKIAHSIVKAVHEGNLSPGALGAGFRAGGRTGEIFITIDLEAKENFQPVDPDCLTNLELQGRQAAKEITDFLQKNVDGFSKSFIGQFPARVGIRESRRMEGKYELTGEDIESGAKFPDGVALATWPMELREKATGAKLRFPKDNLPADIPLRSLQSVTVPNLYAAGRCISATHEAQASIRVIGTCFATGEASGLAAALQANGMPYDAQAVNQLRTRIAR